MAFLPVVVGLQDLLVHLVLRDLLLLLREFLLLRAMAVAHRRGLR